MQGVTAPERQLFFVGTRIVLPQPEKTIKSIDCRLHQALHLFIGDVGDLRVSAASLTRSAGMQILDGSISEGQGDKRLRCARQFRIKDAAIVSGL